jgi:hypothetical protein
MLHRCSPILISDIALSDIGLVPWAAVTAMMDQAASSPCDGNGVASTMVPGAAGFPRSSLAANGAWPAARLPQPIAKLANCG